MCEILSLRGVNYSTRGVYEQSAVVVKSVLAYFGQTAALRSHARHKQETVGNNATYGGEHVGFGGAHHVHHIVGSAPFLGGLEHRFEQLFSCFGIFDKLEIESSFVGGQRQQYHPLAFVSGERHHGVLAHVRGNGHGVKIEIAVGCKESLGVLLRGVAYVAAFGVGNGEHRRRQRAKILHGLFQRHKAADAHTFVKSQIGFVSHGVILCGVDNCLVESKDWVGFGKQVLGYLFKVGVESHAEKRLFPTYLFYKLLACHNILIVKILL